MVDAKSVEAKSNFWGKLVSGSKMKYLGLTLLLAWHYCLWFVPQTFDTVFLLNDRITFGWLINLAASGLTLSLIPMWLGEKRHLCDYPAIIAIAATVAALGTASLAIYCMSAPTPWPAYLLSALIGVAGALLWVSLGETLVRSRAGFTNTNLLPIYGGFLLFSLLMTHVLPGWSSSVFVSILPLCSLWLLYQALKATKGQGYPRLLPKNVAKGGSKAILIVCTISAVTSFVSYFTVTIIPWKDLWSIGESFTYGILIGAVLMLLIAALSRLSPSHYHIFRLFPWMLVFCVVSCVIYLIDLQLNAVVFLIALAVSSIFEVLLIMYTGILPLRGYTTPAVAFGLSGGSIRLGICLGNSLSLAYERTFSAPDSTIRITFLVLIVVLMVLSLTLVRQEYNISALVRSPETHIEKETVYAQITSEFKLSEREKEIVTWLARGYSAAAVAKKLTISVSTVNTHIQHIYEKMGIHKRSELINYLNKQD